METNLKRHSKAHAKQILKFVNVVADLSLTPEEQREFLCAFLTPTELKAFAQRIEIIQMLHDKIPQRDIAAQLNVGIATVTRGNRALYEYEKIFRKVLGNSKGA